VIEFIWKISPILFGVWVLYLIHKINE